MRMRFSLAASLVLGFTALLAGCGKSKNTAATVEVTETVKIWNEATQVLSKVTDKQTAEDARPKMIDLAGRMKKVIEEKNQKEQALKDAGKKLPTLSEGQKKLAEDATEHFKKEAARVRTVEGGQQLLNDFYAGLTPSSKS